MSYSTKSRETGYYHITPRAPVIIARKSWPRTCQLHGPYAAAAPNQKCPTCKTGIKREFPRE
jgi:hypothetical protein